MIFRWSALVRPLFFTAASLILAAPSGAEPKLPLQATIPGVDLAQYRGKVVYLDFWASWCGPCQLSFPFMRDLATRFSDRDLVVVAVNLDHDKARAQGFLSRYHPNFPIAYDPSGTSARAYHVADMPTSIVIGRDGRIRYVHRGFALADQQTYFTHVSELINEHH